VSDYVLDASALLCLIQNEPGADIVRRCLPESRISTVNYAEVVAKLIELGAADADISANLGLLELSVVDFTWRHAHSSGLLRRTTRSFGLSMGDRACLALANSLGATAVTTDRRWADIPDGPPLLIARPE
jgi:ribonuclease VapC